MRPLQDLSALERIAYYNKGAESFKKEFEEFKAKKRYVGLQ